MSLVLNRRGLIGSLAVLGASPLLSACDKLAQQPLAHDLLFNAGNMHKWLQRALTDRDALAKEFRPDQRSPFFRGNGTLNPNTEDYKALWRTGFESWRLTVDGLVARPLSLSLAQLKAMPAREQITRHDCVEGWSAIGKWRGARLKPLLEAAGLSDRARYLVFHCADNMWAAHPYYESLDLIDAFHPQTILAYALNDAPLAVRNGAPLRLRAERHLGYKQAKYLMRIEAVETLSEVYGGKGGFWEDVAGYEAYAAI